jgi:hypothetical protein
MGNLRKGKLLVAQLQRVCVMGVSSKSLVSKITKKKLDVPMMWQNERLQQKLTTIAVE